MGSYLAPGASHSQPTEIMNEREREREFNIMNNDDGNHLQLMINKCVESDFLTLISSVCQWPSISLE